MFSVAEIENAQIFMRVSALSCHVFAQSLHSKITFYVIILAYSL